MKRCLPFIIETRQITYIQHLSLRYLGEYLFGFIPCPIQNLTVSMFADKAAKCRILFPFCPGLKMILELFDHPMIL